MLTIKHSNIIRCEVYPSDVRWLCHSALATGSSAWPRRALLHGAPTLTDIILYISTRIDILWKQRYIFDNGKYISEAEYISGAACTAWLLAGEAAGVCIYVRALSAL